MRFKLLIIVMHFLIGSCTCHFGLSDPKSTVFYWVSISICMLSACVVEINEWMRDCLLARFQCQVTAEPEPSLAWFYNDRPLTSGPRVQLTFDKTTTTLTIPGVTLQDTGDYTCKATNALGDATTKTFLRVRRTLQHSYLMIWWFYVSTDIVCFFLFYFFICVCRVLRVRPE